MRRVDRANPLRLARERAGLTQLELAVRSGVSIGTISIAERGGHLTARSAQRLETVLGDLTPPPAAPALRAGIPTLLTSGIEHQQPPRAA